MRYASLILGLGFVLAFTPAAFAGGKSGSVGHSNMTATKHTDKDTPNKSDADKAKAATVVSNVNEMRYEMQKSAAQNLR